MGKYIEFDIGSKQYERTGSRANFSSATKQSVTQDYNAAHGTNFNHKKSFAKANELSIDHKVAWKTMADVFVTFLNQCHAQLSPTGMISVAAVMKSFRGQFIRYLFKGDEKTGSKNHANTGTRKNNKKYQEAKLALAYLEKQLEQCYKPSGMFAQPDHDYETVCDTADYVLKLLNDSADNLRYGMARVNSAIGEDYDGHTVQTPGHNHYQFTPHTKEQMSSSWAQSNQFMMTPSGDHFLTSDFINPIARGNLTPDSRQRFDDMET